MHRSLLLALRGVLLPYLEGGGEVGELVGFLMVLAGGGGPGSRCGASGPVAVERLAPASASPGPAAAPCTPEAKGPSCGSAAPATPPAVPRPVAEGVRHAAAPPGRVQQCSGEPQIGTECEVSEASSAGEGVSGGPGARAGQSSPVQVRRDRMRGLMRRAAEQAHREGERDVEELAASALEAVEELFVSVAEAGALVEWARSEAKRSLEGCLVN